MDRTRRWIAPIALVALSAGAVAAPTEAPELKRLGRTVVQHKDSTVRAVLSWKYANQTFEKEPWILLELAFAAEGKPVELNREDVSLLTPSGERLDLPSQKRFVGGVKDPRWLLQKAVVAREPVADYFLRQTLEQRLPFFAVPGEQLVQDQIAAGPTFIIHGDLFFEAPTGVWKPGRYTLVLKNKVMDVELPFTFPADDPKGDAKAKDGKAVTW